MRPSPVRALALLCLALAPRPAAGQVTEGPLSPAGRLRIGLLMEFQSWHERFGLRDDGEGTVEEREPLGLDLTDSTGLSLFPGGDALRESLRALLADDGFQGSIGSVRTAVSQSRTVLPLSLDVGVTEWLTVGVTVPFVKNRTEAALAFRADSAAVDLGLNPVLSNGGEVQAFTDELASADAAARARAEELCGGDPGGASCARAREVSTMASTLLGGFLSGYSASPFFLASGTAAGDALLARMAALDAGLQEIGVAPLTRAPVLAAPLDAAAFAGLFTDPAAGLSVRPITDVPNVWALGDVEVRAVARLLTGELREPGATWPRFAWEVGAGALLRLPTGDVDDPDVVFDLPRGDGQLDLEGRAFANLRSGRFGLWGDARYGIQQPRTLLRRIAPPDRVLAPAFLDELEWTPGDYLSLEASPRYHLTDELALTLGYRFRSKGEDRYERVGPAPEAQVDPPGFVPIPFVDPSLLEAETEERLHEVGGGLVYSTLGAWRAGRTSVPLEVRFGVRSAVAGSGGGTPAAVRAVLGVRLYRVLWGRR